MRIYVASSWRNKYFDEIVAVLRAAGHTVYDFKNAQNAFSWQQLVGALISAKTNYRYKHGDTWPGSTLRAALVHPLCERGFNQDMINLMNCDTCVLVLPCGKSAHLEAGWATGARKKVIVHIPPGVETEPELMYMMCKEITTTNQELLEALA